MNKYPRKPLLYILPEDDRNTKIINGFVQAIQIENRSFEVGKVAGGWRKVIPKFQETYEKWLREQPQSRLLMVIDFDMKTAPTGADEPPSRYRELMEQVPVDLKDRVFLIGSWWKPEALSSSIHKTAETLGQKLAEECRDGPCEGSAWTHAMLLHNQRELARLHRAVQDFIFR